MIDTNQGGRKDMKEKRGVFYSARMRARVRERPGRDMGGETEREREGLEVFKWWSGVAHKALNTPCVKGGQTHITVYL